MPSFPLELMLRHLDWDATSVSLCKRYLPLKVCCEIADMMLDSSIDLLLL